MSIKDCVNEARAIGAVSRDEADAMEVLYDNLVKHYGEPNAAKAEMVARLMRQAEHERRQKLLADAKRTELENFMLAFRDARGQADPAQALVALIEHNGLVAMPEGLSSVVGRSKAILGLAQGELETLLNEFRRTWVTGQTRNAARLENLVREAAGEGTGDRVAAGLAKAWLTVVEQLRQRSNAAGSAIGKLDGWFQPQYHDRLAMIRAGKERWIADITEGLDRARIRHPLSGSPMTEADLRASLEWIYNNNTSDGWHERQASAVRPGLGAISGQRADHRFLHFKSVDAWLKYNRAYGGGADPWAAMALHLKGMAEDTAAMEVLGPNPRAMLTYLQNFVLRQASLKSAGLPAHFPDVTALTKRSFEAGGSWSKTRNPEDYARSMIKLSEDMWGLYRGTAGAAVDSRVADVFSVIRNLNVASKLGGATLSAMSDIGFQQVARKMVGLPAVTVYRDIVKAFATGPKRDAVAAGLILDTAVNVLHDQARWAASMQGPVWSRYLGDRTIAWSGLAAWTQACKHAFGLSFMAELARRSAEPFDALPGKMRETFGRYGLSAKDWDALRLDASEDRLFIKPVEVYRAMAVSGRADERIAERYLEMILQETEYAVPVGTLRAQANAFGSLKRGVLIDEVLRSASQFKMFGASVALLQGQRIAATIAHDGMLVGAGFAAGLIITTGLYGGLSTQMKEIAKGRDPRNMNPFENPAFWGAAILQGGGLGIYGDFLAAETNRFGGGFQQTLAGPTADVVAGLLALSGGNIAQRVRGEQTNTGRELVRFLGQTTPGGSLWYLRLAYEHMVLDRLHRDLDPEAYAAFRRKVQNQKKQYGNEFWWAPGETAPRRGPDLGAAFGGR